MNEYGGGGEERERERERERDSDSDSESDGLTIYAFLPIIMDCEGVGYNATSNAIGIRRDMDPSR